MSSLATQRRVTGFRGFSGTAVLVFGVFVVPMALAFATNSWTAPDAAAYVRMAFGTVAGATVAISTVVGLLVHRILRRAPLATIMTFAGIALVVLCRQLSAIGGAAQRLLMSLGG